jgi:hypothetical protein
VSGRRGDEPLAVQHDHDVGVGGRVPRHVV